jgi:transposase InsO family protein
MQPPARMRYSFESRCRAIQAVMAGASVDAAARAQGVSRASLYRWCARFRASSWAGLRDRPSTPHRQPRRCAPELEALILAARDQGEDGPLILAAKLGIAASTVGKVLRRFGRSRRPRSPRPGVVRYERERPGELLHIDIKKLGRFWQVGKRILGDGVTRSPRAGWQYLHVAVDDYSRLAYAELLPSEGREDAARFLHRAVAWYAQQGLHVEAVLTDNGTAYRSQRWREACSQLALRHLRTRPYTPRTNGKAERFIQMLLRRWAYAFVYPTSERRARALSGWLRWYNRQTSRLARWTPTPQPCLTPLWSVQLADVGATFRLPSLLRRRARWRRSSYAHHKDGAWSPRQDLQSYAAQPFVLRPHPLSAHRDEVDFQLARDVGDHPRGGARSQLGGHLLDASFA